MEAEFAETKELDSRQNNGLIVTLWWVKNTLDTFVTVVDTTKQPPIEHHIDIPEGAEPHQVYNHPMAYLRKSA